MLQVSHRTNLCTAIYI